jgi:hypothetical protein
MKKMALVKFSNVLVTAVGSILRRFITLMAIFGYSRQHSNYDILSGFGMQAKTFNAEKLLCMQNMEPILRPCVAAPTL